MPGRFIFDTNHESIHSSIGFSGELGGNRGIPATSRDWSRRAHPAEKFPAPDRERFIRLKKKRLQLRKIGTTDT
jgi:hypothetical protein